MQHSPSPHTHQYRNKQLGAMASRRAVAPTIWEPPSALCLRYELGHSCKTAASDIPHVIDPGLRCLVLEFTNATLISKNRNRAEMLQSCRSERVSLQEVLAHRRLAAFSALLRFLAHSSWPRLPCDGGRQLGMCSTFAPVRLGGRN